MWVVGSNIAIGVYWTYGLLCVLYVGGGINIVECRTWSVLLFSMWVVGSNIAIGVYTGHVVSAVCSLCGGGI